MEATDALWQHKNALSNPPTAKVISLYDGPSESSDERAASVDELLSVLEKEKGGDTERAGHLGNALPRGATM